jgi:hypothetical protein
MIIHKKIAAGGALEFLIAAAGYLPPLPPVHGVSPL